MIKTVMRVLVTPLTQAVALARGVKIMLRAARVWLSDNKSNAYKPSNDNNSKQTSAHTAPPKPVAVSIIIPLLNEADNLSQLIPHVATLNPSPHQVILVDGGSIDGSVTVAKKVIKGLIEDRQLSIEWQVIESATGRAMQMNTGAAVATGDTLLFLHADTKLPNNAITEMVQAMSHYSGQYEWGRFDVRLDSRNPMLWLVGVMINTRSRVTGIATGDQAIFIKKSLFEQVNGYPHQPLMEDIALCKLLKNVVRPACLHHKVTTSARRWQQYGTWRTIILMWHLRFDYWRGVSPKELKQRYYNN
jgi:rSAM/selenodomain-associated transferase 2